LKVTSIEMEQRMITYFVHSTSVDNESQVYSGWNNPKLSEKGLVQAKLVGDRFQSSNFDFVYSSDLTRAQQTARIAFPGVQHHSDPRLREVNYGKLNGAISSKFPTSAELCIDIRFENGENCLDVEAKVKSFLEELNGFSRNIGIVSHKYPQLAFEVICKGLSWSDAIKNDWRSVGQWQPGWIYSYDKDIC